MIELLAGFSDNVVAVLCSSQVTKADYDSVLIPAIAEAVRKQRVAVVTDVEWIKHGVRIFSFLMPGVTKSSFRDPKPRRHANG
jgi:hypothetical protein